MDHLKLVMGLQSVSDSMASAASERSQTIARDTTDKTTRAMTPPLPSPPSDALSSTCPSLTKQQRLLGFGSCFVLGFLLNVGSTFALMLGGSQAGLKFGVTYSVGNLVSLCGSGFLVGPKQQFQVMFKPVRRIATIVYLVMIVVVLTVALVVPQVGLVVLVLVLIQCTAAVWYSASYIPYGRKILVGIAKKVCGTAV